jgi:flagellar biosynthetic protein FlhB
MAEAGPQGERTEAATARRLQRAREDGNVPQSRELTSFVVLAAATVSLVLLYPAFAARLAASLAGLLAGAGSLTPREASLAALAAAARASLPAMALVLAAGAAVTLLQTGFALRSGAFTPDFARIDPRAGLRRLFGWQKLADIGIGLAKLGLLIAVLWPVLAAAWPRLAAGFWQETPLLLRAIGQIGLHVLLAALLVQAAFAAFDVFRERLHYARTLRMSHQEIRDEAREAEGDPKIKARIRQIRTARARRRMLARVKQATVVVTNPEHYAVALHYAGDGAPPRVAAKGVDSMAARIREVAMAHTVPLVPNPPLARALYIVPLDAEIPTEHYKAVAEIIAYVWRLERARLM